MAPTFRIASGLLMVMLACAVVISDEPPVKSAPPAKKADAKQAAAPSDEPAKKKVKAPPGYEDAPEAGDLPAVRAVGVIDEFFEAVDEVGFAKALAQKVNPQVANLEMQLQPQFTPLMTAELSFINRVCDLNLEQRKKIKASSDQCLQEAVRRYALSQSGMVRRQVKGQTVIPDPTDLLHQSLAKVLRATLQPKQRAAYENEMAQRQVHRKRVAVENLVAMIDERLVLTNDQRRKLMESLDKNWQAAWVQSVDVLMSNSLYLPMIPERVIVPLLSDAQQIVWRSIPKNNFASWDGFGVGLDNELAVLDDFPLVETEAYVENTPAD